MKKQLFDLTIEEFTSVLLDYQPTLELSVCCYDEKGNFINKQITDGEDEEVTVRGAYSDFYNAFLKEPCNNGVKEAVKGFLDSHFDYDMQLNRLDIYNYLEHITSNFHEEKVRIVLNEMDCFYLMVYLEDIDSDVENQYIEKGWEIPTVTRKNRINGQEYTCIDYETMREKIYPCRGFMYHNAIRLLKKKLQSDEPTSPIYFTARKGEKTDFIRIVNAMYELGFFTGKDETKISKKCVFEEFGKLVNLDLADYQNLLSKANKGCNADGNSQQNRIFERLKEVSMKKDK